MTTSTKTVRVIRRNSGEGWMTGKVTFTWMGKTAEFGWRYELPWRTVEADMPLRLNGVVIAVSIRQLCFFAGEWTARQARGYGDDTLQLAARIMNEAEARGWRDKATHAAKSKLVKRLYAHEH